MRRLLCVLLLLASAAFAQQSYDQLLQHWDYDHNAPLAVNVAGVQERNGVKVQDLVYASPVKDRSGAGPNAGKVSAYLVVPPGKGPFPAVIYGHWCMPGSAQLNRTEFLDEAVVLARAGVISLLPDHVIALPGFVADKTPLNAQQIDVLVQQVVNTRRGADLLLSRKDVDPKRLAYVGHSCNGEVGGFLSGMDKRFKAFVIMAGPLSDEVAIKTRLYQDYRQKVGAEKFDAFIANYSWTDPGKYVSRSQGIPKLLQFATDEPMLNPELAREYLPYVSDPKTLKVYEAPHALNPAATRDRINFLAEQLAFSPPDANAVAGIPVLAQPPWPKPPGSETEAMKDKGEKKN